MNAREQSVDNSLDRPTLWILAHRIYSNSHRSLHMPHLCSLSGALGQVVPLLNSILPSPRLHHLELDMVRDMLYGAWVDEVMHCLSLCEGKFTLHIGYAATVPTRGYSCVEQSRAQYWWSLAQSMIESMSLVLINLSNKEVVVSSLWLHFLYSKVCWSAGRFVVNIGWSTWL